MGSTLMIWNFIVLLICFNMASSDRLEFEELATWFERNLLQLTCENVSWGLASDKVPHEVALHILGDLPSKLRCAIYLRDNRVLLDVDISDDLRSEFVQNLTGKGHSMDFKGYTCRFSFSRVGNYKDLVEIMCNVRMQGWDSKLLEEDVFVYFDPPVNPVFRYLPPVPSDTSTPKKDSLASKVEQAVESLEHEDPGVVAELVRLLIDQRGLDYVPKSAIPKLDIPVSGVPKSGVPESSNRLYGAHGPSAIHPHESFAQASQSLVRELAEKGMIRGNIPKLDIFSADEKSKVAFTVWERQVSALIPDYPESTIKVAVRNSLKGRAQEDISVLSPTATLQNILETLRTKYQVKASYDSLMSKFYNLAMEDSDDCAAFSSKLEQKLTNVQILFPHKLEGSTYWITLRDRFFHGVPAGIRSNIRNEYSKGAPYYELVTAARMIESETKQDKPAVVSPEHLGKQKGKAQVSALNIREDPAFKKLEAAQSQTSQDMKGIQSILQDLTLAIGKMQQGPIPQPATNSFFSGGNGQRGRGAWRGGRGFERGRGSSAGRGYGRPPTCYWCKDHVSLQEANHRIQDCPLYNECREQCWKDHSGGGSTSNPRQGGN